MAKRGHQFDKQIYIYDRTIGNTNFRVPIKMHFNGTDKVSYSCEYRGKYRFSQKCDTLPELISFIDLQLRDVTEIVWEPFIQIEVKSLSKVNERKDGNSRFYRANAHTKTEIEIESELIEIGTDKEGKKWRRNQYESSIYFYAADLDKFGRFPEDDWTAETVRSLIPDTPENREKLELFTKRFRDLSEMFFHVFLPNNVVKFLDRPAKFLLTTGDKE